MLPTNPRALVDLWVKETLGLVETHGSFDTLGLQDILGILEP